MLQSSFVDAFVVVVVAGAPILCPPRDLHIYIDNRQRLINGRNFYDDDDCSLQATGEPDEAKRDAICMYVHIHCVPVNALVCTTATLLSAREREREKLPS